MRKIIVTVAPVCHVGKEIPAECKNPLSPEEIAEDTINCYRARVPSRWTCSAFSTMPTG